MKKLIELLNEHQTEKKSKFKFSSYDINSGAFIIEKNPRMVLGEETVISKKFWFIQWLVEEDKLDKGWLFNIITESCVFDGVDMCSESDYIIMYLAIQDDPISFLSSILK